MAETTEALFAAALRDRGRPMPDGITAWTAPPAERRFAVHRDNVSIGLARALASRFPATERIVGRDFFAAMAAAFVREHPPRSPVLLAYGDEFADFVARFAPAAALAYLPDVVRLEAARSRAYHAADAVSLDPAVVAAVGAERLPGLRLRLHPSVAVVRSIHPVVTIWAMNVGDAVAEPIADWAAEEALVIRPRLSVAVHRLPAGGGVFVEALGQGAALGVAAGAALAAEPAFDLAATLACVLGGGLFTAVL